MLSLLVWAQFSFAQVSEGYIDLRAHNFFESNHTLKGQWEYYDSLLLSPKQIASGDFREQKTFFPVPGLWNNKDTSFFNSGMGFATYRLRFKTDTQISVLSININKVQNAYKLWINDSLYAHEGKVGRNRDKSEPVWKSRNYSFLNRSSGNEIVLQVSNFYHKKGGLEHAPYVGLPEKTERSSWQILGFDHFIMGLLLIMGIYHFGLFILKRNEWGVLFFGFLTLTTVVFSLTAGEIALTYFLPDFNWEILVKTNYVSNYARVLFFGLFIGGIFPAKARRKILNWAAGFAAVMILFIVFTPARIYTHTLPVFFGFVLFMVVFFTGVTVKATFRKKQGAVYSLIGTFVLLAAIINDVVKEIFLINMPSTATYGLFVFVLLQADMLAFRSVASFKELKKLTGRLLSVTKIKDELLSNNSSEPRQPLRVIARNINARYALAVIVQKDDQWQVIGEYFNGKLINPGDENYLDFEKRTNYDVDYDLIYSAIDNMRMRCRYVSAGGNTNKKTKHFFNKVCMPVTKGNEVISLFYAENRLPFEPFGEETERILNLIRPQLSVITQNALAFDRLEQFNRGLEETVREHTEEIIQQSEELRAQKEEIEAKNNILDEAAKELSLQNTHISDSINYARRIQQSLFPAEKEMKEAFDDTFVFFKPRDVLSGDFYWSGISEQGRESHSVLAVADATGHGVPGALMSVIGDNLISAAVYEKGLYKPSAIIDYLDKELIERLDKKHSKQFENDGINIGVLSYNKRQKKILYSGAYHPLYITQSGEIKKYKGRNRTAGMSFPETIKAMSYFDHEIYIDKGTLYLCSDGFIKQIADAEQKKFTRKDFSAFLVEISQVPFSRRKQKFEEKFEMIKGSSEQTDDVLVVALNFDKQQ